MKWSTVTCRKGNKETKSEETVLNVNSPQIKNKWFLVKNHEYVKM